jgi:CRISPR-associated protein Cpf1
MNEFTNLYQLQKTLRFELKPVGETEKLVRALFEVPEENHCEVIDKDLKLSKSYKQVKQLMDCRHRQIIDNVLSNFKFTEEELNLLSTKLSEEDTDASEIGVGIDNKDPFGKIRERLSTELNKVAKIMFDNKILNSRGNELCGIEKWMTDNGNDKYLNLNNNTKINKEEMSEHLKKMKGFFTYFNGFKENRKNVYSKNKIATSVPFRIIHDNFPIFKKNIENYEKIKNDYPELVELIDKRGANEIFDMQYFNTCLTQEGISEYNEKIGNIAKEQGIEQDKGINQIINEFAQEENKKIKEKTPLGEKPKKVKVATFDKLKKQILSIRETKSFQFSVFESTKDIVEGINNCLHLLTTDNKGIILIDEIKQFLADIHKYDLEEIYLNEKFIGKQVNNAFVGGTLSKKLFGQGGYIRAALENFADKCYTTKSERQKFLNSKQFSIKILEDSIRDYLQQDKSEKGEELRKKYDGTSKIILDYFQSPTITVTHEVEDKTVVYEEKNLFEELDTRKNAISHILNGNYSKDLKDEKESGEDGEKVKCFLDALLEFHYLLSPFAVKNKDLRDGQEKDEEFYEKRKRLQELLFDADILDIYNQTRNYITKKPYRLDKFKLTFGHQELLKGHATSKEQAYKTTILRHDGEYFLLIFPESNELIYSEKVLDVKNNLYYEKMFYDQMADSSKDIPNLMVENGKTVRKIGRKEKDGEYEGENLILEAHKNRLLPKEINEIRINKSYLRSSENFNYEDLQKYIRYYEDRLVEYKSNAKFTFKEEYESFKDFTDDVDAQAYQLNFNTKISKNWLDEQVRNGKLYLFKIHNKDFNKGSHGTKNLHTLYWEMLFDPKNLDDVQFKLNGEAELFYREASVKKTKNTIHNTGIKVPRKFLLLSDGSLEPVPGASIKRLNKYFKDNIPEDQWAEEDKKYKDNFSIIGKKDNKKGIIKDERFTKDKIQFHCSITMNFKSKDKDKNLNDRVLKFLHHNDDVHIIGLDRGERNLIYLTMINKKGEIISQYSLNELTRPNYQDKEEKINYHSLLSEKEISRTEARKNWNTIEGIKELKEGYLALVVHKIAKLVIENKAIIVMENLNYGFKDSRANIEKQIYQKFETALIKKLQYLVMDKGNLYDAGGVLKAYQLVNSEIPAYKDMEYQNGILFYVFPDYTSKIDPTTQFVNLLNTRYTNINNAKTLISKFDKIYFDTKNDYFRFEFDYKNFDNLRVDAKELNRTQWSVCSHKATRAMSAQSNNKWSNQKVNVNEQLKQLFESQNINYTEGVCMKTAICQIGNAKFFEELLKYLSVLLALRHTWKESDGTESDIIVSSVEETIGSNKFFVSKDGNKLPANADANGAYNIARKGLWLLQQLDTISDEEKAVKHFNNLKKTKKIKVDDKKQKKVSQWCNNKEWLNYVQKGGTND